ncbi:MAG: gnl 3 [Chthoniobacteraceae bacterium]|nr:gnl 3 [Chthoniobacteraceae bacterium]
MRILFFCVLSATAALAADDFKASPEHEASDNVPHGTVTRMPAWESKVFAGTIRDWSIYVPAQYKAEQPASVMVFQDGHDYVNTKGNWRVPIVFDNLIASGEMPVTIAIFLDPGQESAKEKPTSAWNNSNRSFEYDSLGDRYARFLLEEILPEVEKSYRLSHAPADRAISGASSGGICSFTVAWEHPEAFGKVLSTIGSFTNIRGGNVYPSLIRKSAHKPIRVYLEDAGGDVDNQFGNWPLANQQMYSALKYMGYDTRFDYVDGFAHSSKHGGSIFPEALKWLWRKETPKVEAVITKNIGGDLPLQQLLIEGEEWQLVAEGLGFADGPCADAEGNFYFSDMKAPGIFKMTPDGLKTQISNEGASGLKWGPDGRLYACQGSKKRVIVINTADGAISVMAEEVQPNDLVVTQKGDIYITETGIQQITKISGDGKSKVAADNGVTGPNGIALSPDGGTLAVSDYKGQNAWVFRIESDGALTAKSPFMTLRTEVNINAKSPDGRSPVYNGSAAGDGMTTDTIGRYYVTSALGVQVFDSTGRLCGVIPKPQPSKPLTSCALAGTNRDYLYVTNGDKIFCRKVHATGNPPPVK